LFHTARLLTLSLPGQTRPDCQYELEWVPFPLTLAVANMSLLVGTDTVKRKLAGAQRRARALLRHGGARAVIKHRRARTLMSKGKWEQATIAAQSAIELAPAYAEAHNTLALIRLAQGDPNRSRVAAGAAIAAAPEYAEARHTLALCDLAKGDLQSALASIQTTLSLAPHYVEAYYTQGRILRGLDRLADAEQSFREALRIYPDYVEAMNQLGTLLQDRGLLDEAEEILRKAAELRPGYADAHNNLGFVLRQKGNSAAAAESFRAAHALFEPHLVLPEGGQVHRTLADLSRSGRVMIDLARWNITGHARPNAWTDYRLLHQSTNGVLSDKLNRLLQVVSKVSDTPREIESPLFPWIKRNNFPQIMDALDRDGLYVFDHLLAPEIVDEIVAYATTTEAKLTPPHSSGRKSAVFDASAPLSTGYQFDEAQMLELPTLQKFMGDSLLHEVSQAYFGVEPRLAYMVMWWSAVYGRIPTSDMAQLFHTDLAHIKWLKTFVYLSDVTEGTGPHSFVKGSHKADQDGLPLRQRGLVRFSDEDMVNAYGRERVVDLIGPRGTVFIADTRGFHKGHLPRTGPRLVLQVYHVNSLFPDAPGKKVRPVRPVDPVLVEAVKRHPRTFAGYQIQQTN
jgi:tetratricopeptide (TPR) repeat protein